MERRRPGRSLSAKAVFVALAIAAVVAVIVVVVVVRDSGSPSAAVPAADSPAATVRDAGSSNRLKSLFREYLLAQLRSRRDKLVGDCAEQSYRQLSAATSTFKERFPAEQESADELRNLALGACRSKMAEEVGGLRARYPALFDPSRVAGQHEYDAIRGDLDRYHARFVWLRDAPGGGHGDADVLFRTQYPRLLSGLVLAQAERVRPSLTAEGCGRLAEFFGDLKRKLPDCLDDPVVRSDLSRVCDIVMTALTAFFRAVRADYRQIRLAASRGTLDAASIDDRIRRWRSEYGWLGDTKWTRWLGPDVAAWMGRMLDELDRMEKQPSRHSG